MSLLFSQLPDICGGKLLHLHEDHSLVHLLTDSRKPIFDRHAMFIAMKGANHDGHRYIKELYAQGLRSFIVETGSAPELSALPEANILAVENSLRALQLLVKHHRAQFSLPLLGITGSNGKTIIKEWLSHFISDQYLVLKSPGSFNSQLGVALSLWPLAERHQWAIIEAGISQAGEMKRLEAMIAPTEGIFTNLGTAHDEGFASSEEKAAEKALLFRQCGRVYYCADQPLVATALQAQARSGQELIAWSARGNAADWQVKTSTGMRGTTIELSGKVEASFEIPFRERGMIENMVHCLVYLLDRGFAPLRLQEGISSLPTVQMRLELKQGINGCYIVDDTYNNDLAGLELALDFLEQQKQREKHTLILSDVLQSGGSGEEIYARMALLCKSRNLHRFIGIGEAISAHRDVFAGLDSQFFSTTQDFLDTVDDDSFHEELILIKGARSFRFEDIVIRLQQKIHGTRLEINLNALTHNLNFFRKQLRGNTKIMVMVKAFAYGGGSAEIARLLQYHRVDYLGVAYVDEGIFLRKQGIHLPIMVLNPSVDSWQACMDYQLEPELYSIELLRSFLLHKQRSGRQVPIHIKLDTGMHRLGFSEEELPALLALMQEYPDTRVASIFSHMAAADEEQQDEFSHRQASTFAALSSHIMDALGQKPLRHLLNSAGILRFPQYHHDMVRLGIGLYGVDPTGAQQEGLQTVSTLRTTVSQVKKIAQGETVGYGRKGVANRDIQIATLAIGYADGFSRIFSQGNGKVWINGALAPVVGNVCMDMTMVDVTDIGVQAGDEAVIFGPELSLKALAAWAGTIPYEILTNIRERVKRVFYSE